MFSNVTSTHNQLLEVLALVFGNEFGTSRCRKHLSFSAAHGAQVQNKEVFIGVAQGCSNLATVLGVFECIQLL
eukprot:Skav205211  [mRNA]  locus=scaffold376:209813:210031:- [translate_table: standard]